MAEAAEKGSRMSSKKAKEGKQEEEALVPATRVRERDRDDDESPEKKRSCRERERERTKPSESAEKSEKPANASNSPVNVQPSGLALREPEEPAAVGCARPDDPIEWKKQADHYYCLFLQARRRMEQHTKDLGLCREELQARIKDLAMQERVQQQEMRHKETLRLGEKRIHIIGSGETWEHGSEFKELALRRKRIEEERADIQRQRMSVNQSKKKNDQDDDPEKDSWIWEQRELFNVRMEYLKRDENGLNLLEQKLLQERALHEKKLRIQNQQRISKYNMFPLLAQRYQLGNLIGKGGFSEVYKAYCLETLQVVAIKIHELKKGMSESEKITYVRHAIREFEIQKELKHPRIVALLDRFAIDENAFGTVLEYCTGETLDDHLKSHGALTEKEARGIVIQILSGLRAMNMPNGQKIIHYDLKPSNLIYNRGELKITDFGLSKIVQRDGSSETMENTSQGCGTYWYLPPECLEAGGFNSRISSKVDVWSTGVIMYEMVYARRPFGNNLQSQDGMWSTQRSFFELEFPETPKVSTEYKECIKRLLGFESDKRPDVIDAYNDPYFRRRGNAPA